MPRKVHRTNTLYGTRRFRSAQQAVKQIKEQRALVAAATAGRLFVDRHGELVTYERRRRK